MASIIRALASSAALFGAFGAVPAASAEVVLDTLFQDHAVLQRGRPIPVTGRAAPGEEVRVEFGPHQAKSRAGADGRFRVELPAMEASTEGRVLRAAAASGSVEAKDIVVGEVWFCSGQSNMEWTVDASGEAERARSAAGKLPIRSFKAPHVTANEPKDRVAGAWRVAGADTVGGFTAVGFWFGADLARSFMLEVPVGLVDISWGGTRIEPWIPLDEMAKSEFAGRADELARLIAASRGVSPQQRAEMQATEDARFATERDGYWLKALAGEVGQREGWSQPEQSDGFPAGWSRSALPAFYPALDRELAAFDGFVWCTRAFEVPAALAGKPLVLELPAIDDCDHVWIDGVPVGNTVMNWNTPRRYEIPAGLAAGEHRIAVCVLDAAGQGGFAPGAMRLAGSGASVDLAGEWLWRKGGGAPQVAVPSRRDLSREPGTEPHEPAAIYNAMMAPCIAFPVRGTIWYQGESNAGEPDAYRKLLPLLMNSWRAKSGNPEMAWGIVQLAAFMPFVEAEPAQGAWALLREAQFRGAREGRGGMVSAIDLGDAGDIHPRRKREVGERLAAWARSTVFGEARALWQGPELVKAVRKGARVVCSFDHAVGLQARGGALGGFALAGADGRWAWADARIEGETVVVESAAVAEPVEIAYAWQNNPERANLANGAYLPAVPFRAKIAKE